MKFTSFFSFAPVLLLSVMTLFTSNGNLATHPTTAPAIPEYVSDQDYVTVKVIGACVTFEVYVQDAKTGKWNRDKTVDLCNGKSKSYCYQGSKSIKIRLTKGTERNVTVQFAANCAQTN